MPNPAGMAIRCATPLPSGGASNGESDAGELEAFDVGFVCVSRRVGGSGGAGFLLGEETEFVEASRLEEANAGRGLLDALGR
jgi:alpha-D-ribose 1-methylphosphonate 5-triphosphate synthase subunit PhnG